LFWKEREILIGESRLTVFKTDGREGTAHVLKKKKREGPNENQTQPEKRIVPSRSGHQKKPKERKKGSQTWGKPAVVLVSKERGR